MSVKSVLRLEERASECLSLYSKRDWWRGSSECESQDNIDVRDEEDWEDNIPMMS